ncbi:urea ABC transporter permease subunit UrtB [Acetobacter orientalis]|uniref:Branched-chain amino acid ABC transporter permease n=1 Tax=Acetobacter orientalis TaxID=146474 RepID=A0A2Z5ZEM6_9PROT|nr:urea ABC transporter permease subunit UrtB [Acetobacter orientalis]MDN6041191.1 urea ABC transporter permease subunit UrtB [Acetobacter sp.]MCP1216629.1 urea ABC transporter permease subunit UrtB [Acetobacter orientalis]MCP1219615.1 urea ABC transporter permease subunit UrtB [Acetobacter orientalis]BBC78998.1 branched-chain amino acid ABC transporter permease [Acetobacter orientalis]GAN66278.1 urea short-chain amide or branched-chain amino acid transporter permease [Acetobacter orientalis]
MRKLGLACLLAALCLGGGLGGSSARADDFSGLASPQFEDVSASITALAANGSAQADAALQALEAHHLFSGADGALFIHAGEVCQNARTGEATTCPEEGLKPVRVNNRIRKVLAGVQAVRELSAPQPEERIKAAETFYTRHDAALLPALDNALSSEKVPAVREKLMQAHAATVLAQPPAEGAQAARLKAVGFLAEVGGLEARGLLAGVAANVGEAPDVRHAAQSAVSRIDWHLRVWSVLQNAFYGLSYGSVLLLAATGLAITFGVMGVINMAHGEMMMIGAYVTWLVQQGIKMTVPALEPFAILIAIPVAFVVCGGIGVVIERSLIRFLYGRPLETLLATWGLSLVLQQVIRSLFGPTNIAVQTPAWLSGSIALGGLDITLNRLAILVFAGLVLGGLMLVLRRTPLGLQMRAVTQNRRMAALMGIRTPKVDALAFGLGAGLAGLAGVAVSQIDNVSPNLGQSYIIDSFMVVVFGGVGNLWGTLAAAMALGMGGKVLEPTIGAVSAKIAILVLVIAYIQRHPRGMFPVRGRGIES